MPGDGDRVAAAKPIRVLQLEDNQDDAQLALVQLRRAKLNVVAQRVQTREDFLHALEDFAPDIVLSDFMLPGFDGGQALALVRARYPKIPVLMLSGVLGDEGAVELLKAGACDFVLKDRVARLPAALSRALDEARERRQREDAEEDARQLAQRLSLATESAQLGIWDLDLKKNLLVWDARMFELYGVCPEDFGGAYETWKSGLHPEDRASTMAAVDEAIAGTHTLHTQFRIVRPDAQVRHLEVHAVVLKDRDGRAARMIGVNRDISQSKLAELSLRESERRFRSTLENADLVSVMIDRDDKVIHCNDYFLRVAGWAREDVIGQDWFERFIPAALHPQVRAVRAELLQDLSRAWHQESEILTRSGTRRLIRWNHSVLRSSSGEVSGSSSIGEDITEQVASRSARERLAAMVEGSNDAIIGTNFEGLITDWNQAAERLWGYARDEAIGRPVSIIVPPEADVRKEVDERIRRMAAGQTIRNEEGISVRKDGRRFAYSLNLSHIRDHTGAPTGLMAVVQDISVAQQNRKALLRVNRALKTLSAGTSAVAHASSEHQLLGTMCQVVVESGGYPLAWVGFAENDAAKSVRPAARAGSGAEYVRSANLSWADTDQGRGPTGLCIRSGVPQVARDISNDPRMAPWRVEAKKFGYVSSVDLPLKSPQGVIGVLNILAGEADAFDGDELDLLAELAANLSYGIVSLRTRAAHERTLQRLEAGLEATVHALASTVESRDPYTAGHQQRVAQVSVELAHALGLHAEQVHGLQLAATIHDIGKLSIPAEILTKPGRLTSLEYELIKTHAEAGYQILKGVEFPWPVAEMVRQHHERIDGSGYPRGLKGDQILLEARILSVADVIEAMSAHRPYRAGKGIEAALAEIVAGRGTAFDASVVDACVALFRDHRYQIPT